MAIDDNDKYELLRRRLEDDVKASVERKLFRYYRNFGSAIIGVLGLVGVTIGWPALVGIIETNVQIQIKKQVDAPVAKAKVAAANARKIVNESLPKLEAKQDNLNESIGRIGPRYDELNVRLGNVKSQIKKLENTTVEMKQLAEFFRNQAQADPVRREDIEKLEKLIGEIAGQTGSLAAAISRASGPLSLGQEIKSSENALVEIAADQEKLVDDAKIKKLNPQENSIVYIQFAGGKRATIQKISEELQSKNWQVPGEERTSAAAGKSEIRYYHDSDELGAIALAADIREALKIHARKFNKEIAVRKLDPGNFKVPPVPGILEVRVEIPL